MAELKFEYVRWNDADGERRVLVFTDHDAALKCHFDTPGSTLSDCAELPMRHQHGGEQ